MSYRRTLTTRAKLFAQQRFSPSFALTRHDDEDRKNHHEDPKLNDFSNNRSFSSCTNSSFIGLGLQFRDRGCSPFIHPMMNGLFLGRHMSTAIGGEGGAKIEYISDVAEVLTDKAAEVVISQAPVVSEVAVAAADSWLPVAGLQYVIDVIHNFTGCNWWASIALTTILIRLLILPFTIHQLKATSKLTKYITSISAGLPWIWPFFAVLSTSTGNGKSLAMQASSSEDDLADQVLNQILSAIEKDSSSTNEVCTTYINKLCRAKNLSAAGRLLQSLHDKHVFLSVQAYNLLLSAACEENNTDLASKFFKDMLFYHQVPDSVTYLNLARAFKKNDDSIFLLNFVREVSELTSSGGAIVINRIIYAFADCGQFDTALLIFHHVKSLKCEPDLITYNTIIGILGRTARIDEMLHEFASMKELNLIPDIVSYNTVLHSLGRVGRLDMCLTYLKEMDEKRVEPDLRTYTPLIESFGRWGNVEGSLRIFNEMKHKKIHPSIYVYRSLISNCKRMGKSELAVTLSQEMNACLANLVGPKDFKQKNR